MIEARPLGADSRTVGGIDSMFDFRKELCSVISCRA
jgi:hypothetical protein